MGGQTPTPHGTTVNSEQARFAHGSRGRRTHEPRAAKR